VQSQDKIASSQNNTTFTIMMEICISKLTTNRETAPQSTSDIVSLQNNQQSTGVMKRYFILFHYKPT